MITKKRLNQIISKVKCPHCGSIRDSDVMSAMTEKENHDWNKTVHKGLMFNKDLSILEDCDQKIVAEIE
jgi:hypothetical protein